MAQKVLGVALVGSGRMGWIFAQALGELRAETKLLWVINRTEVSAQKLAEHFSCQFSTDLNEALTDPAVAAVVIATSTPSHAEIAIACARAGKAFFVEKPVADTLENGLVLVREVERAGVPNMVGFQRRYDPAYSLAKTKINAGVLGKPEIFRSISRDTDMSISSLEFHLESGGLIVDLGVHDMDLARFFIGEVSEVQAWGGALAYPDLAGHKLHDTAVALLRFENGAFGTIEMARRTSYGHEVRTEVLGEHGKLSIERDQRGDLREYSVVGGNFDRPRGFEERFMDAYKAEIAVFVRGVLAGQKLLPDVRDAWHSLRLAFAAQHSLETGEPVLVQEFGPEP